MNYSVILVNHTQKKFQGVNQWEEKDPYELIFILFKILRKKRNN
jgi:hypothetical protein